MTDSEKQEPVAWMSPSKQLYRTRWEAIKNGEQMVTPLYTAPVHATRNVKRSWVGLTDEEVMGLTCECVDDGTFNRDCAYDFARAIEAKLKEENYESNT
jgi:hypothetical protein